MLGFPFLLRKKREEITLILDIGTEAIKALFLGKKDGKVNILRNSLEYFDSDGAFEGRSLEQDVLKRAILKTLQGLGFGNLKLKKNLSVIFGLPANILKAKVILQNLERDKSKKIIDEKEERNIFQRALEGAKGKICQIYGKSSGILPQDIRFINSKILEIKIDGYKVFGLRGYEGKNLDLAVLLTFLPEYYLKSFENICQSIGFINEKIIHEAEGLTSCFKENPDGIFLDVGGEISQILLVNRGRLKEIDEFDVGGKFFSRALSEKLGLRLPESRILKERYSEKELSKESSDRIKEFFYFPCENWFENLKLKLKKMNPEGFFPQDIILFGGGSQLPEISEILKKGNWADILFNAEPNIKTFKPAEFKIINDETKNLNNSQYTPSLLIYYAPQHNPTPKR